VAAVVVISTDVWLALKLSMTRSELSSTVSVVSVPLSDLTLDLRLSSAEGSST